MHVVNTNFERPDQSLIEMARDTWVCIAGQVAGRRHAMDSGVRPLRRDWRIAGPALTIAPESPFDTLVSRAAMHFVKPGDVVVVEAAGRMEAACWGATMTWGAKEVGAEAIVADGAVLTTELLIDHEDVPVFCRGSVAAHIGGNGPGSINVPIVCGGVIVNPGDIVLGDEDGIVVLPAAQAADILQKAGQARKDPYPPTSRKVPFTERGYVDQLKALDGIEWN